jgi:hypothetical protein
MLGEAASCQPGSHGRWLWLVAGGGALSFGCARSAFHRRISPVCRSDSQTELFVLTRPLDSACCADLSPDSQLEILGLAS